MNIPTPLKNLLLILVALSLSTAGCSKDPEPAKKPDLEADSSKVKEKQELVDASNKAGKKRAAENKKETGAKDKSTIQTGKGEKPESKPDTLTRNKGAEKGTKTAEKNAPASEDKRPAADSGANPDIDKESPGAKAKEKSPSAAVVPQDQGAVQERLGPVRAQAAEVIPAPLNIDPLIVQKDLKKALGISKSFVTLPLTGQEPSPTYNHRRLVPRGAGPVLGLTIQVWRDHTIADARKKYSGFLKSYPGASENRSVTNRTFFARSRYDENLYIGYFALRERTNVVLTCNASVCDAETLHKVALATKKRLPSFIKN